MKTKDLACGCTVEFDTSGDYWWIIYEGDYCIDPSHYVLPSCPDEVCEDMEE